MCVLFLPVDIQLPILWGHKNHDSINILPLQVHYNAMSRVGYAQMREVVAGRKERHRRAKVRNKVSGGEGGCTR